MYIHTVKPGETVFKIARKYSVSPMKIIENNELLNPDRLTVGQQLLILTPTRTYNVRGSDTLKRIADRFGVKYESLLSANPYLSGKDKLYPGQTLAIKYENELRGVASANGYYYRTTSPDRLSLAMPYLSYVTVSLIKRCGGKTDILFDDTEVTEEIRENGRAALMRVYDCDTDLSDEYIDDLILLAKTHGYNGITLAAYRSAKEKQSEFEKFLIKLKKRLMEQDLLLFCELDGNENTDIADICDGYLIMYDKGSLDTLPSFEEGECRLLTDFADKNESSKAYIEIPSLAYMNDEVITKDEANRIAHTSAKELMHNDTAKMTHFKFNKYVAGKRVPVNVRYESLENVKAKLELAAELGFMGICFDIMHIPVEYLMMFETMFTRPAFNPLLG